MPELEDSGQLISVTANAAEKVRALAFDRARSDDHAVSAEGVTILVDPQSAPLVRGRTRGRPAESAKDVRMKPKVRSSERKERVVAKIEDPVRSTQFTLPKEVG